MSEQTDLGYPGCPDPRERSGAAAPPGPGEEIARGFLRAGPHMRDSSVVERFEIRRRDCILSFRARQEWIASTTDLDVAYDAETQLPLRVWKRVAMPGPTGDRDRIEVARFELRGTRVALTERAPDGTITSWLLRGSIPTALIGPGRGLITMWLQRVRLPVGGRVRETALDLRERMELIRDVTLRRLEDRDDPILGRRVRVYTIYGREPIYADENDVVIGDMMGLVPGDMITEPLPAAAPVPEPDPTRLE